MKDDYLKILEYTTNCKKFIEDILGLEVKPFHEEWIEMMHAEEEHVDWIETQLSLIEKMGLQNYIQSQASD